MSSRRCTQPPEIAPDLVGLIKEKLDEALQQGGRVNILVAGKTGGGKSTLVNAGSQGNLATTGQGRPVTTQTREDRKDGVSVSIFDARGLELQKFEETLNDLV